jgi:hypothetical protein
MLESLTLEQNHDFEDRGQRWARCMLHRLQEHWLEIPLVWPGTREQAETIVHAFTDETLADDDREHLVDVVEKGARVAWRDIARTAHVAKPQAAAES